MVALRNPGPAADEAPAMHDFRYPLLDDDETPRPAMPDPWAMPAEPEPFAPTGPADPTALLPWMDDLMSFGETTARAAPELEGGRRQSPTRVADREAPNSTNRLPNQNWDSMTRATIQERWAPGSVQLPKEVAAGLDDAWKRTEDDKNEHGGNVLRAGAKGNSTTKYTGSGNGAAFEPSPELTDGKTFVGTFHTHPLEPGDTDNTFSGRDLANMSDAGKRVSLQRAGENTHMIARTKEFEAMLNAADDPTEFSNRMEAEWEREYARALNGDPKRYQEALERATQRIAAKYHLLYYSGKGDLLHRVGGPNSRRGKKS